jgi:hypothetical protein
VTSKNGIGNVRRTDEESPSSKVTVFVFIAFLPDLEILIHLKICIIFLKLLVCMYIYIYV